MKHTLNYGRTSWSYDDDFDPKVPGRPFPLVSFTPIRILGRQKTPEFTDKSALLIFKHKTPKTISFRDAYFEWHTEGAVDRDLGEGRAFLRWLIKKQISIAWKKNDFKLHAYFMQENSPKHSPDDEMAKGLSFAISPVVVKERNVKLYLQDDAVLNLLSLPYGEEQDFLELVKHYIAMRFQWEEWRAPAPPFLDWVKVQAKRPVFSSGQLGLCL